MNSVASIVTGSDVRCLAVHIGEGKVLVPLLSELPRAKYRAFAKAMAGVINGTSDDDGEELVDQFFAEYLGRDVVDSMKQSDYIALVKAWGQASADDAGASLGE